MGITIDSARVFFTSAKRRYIIIDAPGHIEFLKNMVSGASRAEAALLIVDAREGIQENSRRHGYMLGLLGIRQVAVLINKMDLVAYGRETFDHLVQQYSEFLRRVDVKPLRFIPVCGRDGENVAARGSTMRWYTGQTVLETLDEFVAEPPPLRYPFRMPVQGVYKFTQQGDDRRIIAGTVETGALRTGDEIVFYPSGKKSHVRTIEAFGKPPQLEVSAGSATGFTLQEQIYVARGEVATRASETRPKVTSRLRVSLFWLGRIPLVTNKEYVFKLGTARVMARMEAIGRVLDTSTLESPESSESPESPGSNEPRTYVGRHEVAECSLKLDRAVAFDLTD